MITKGIIKTIDYNNNSCKVRIPLYETPVSTEEAVFPAVFLNQPGMYNGYNEGDIVFVGFENDSIDEPIILGKLYLGASKEEAVSKKGGFTAANLHITEKAILPLDTQLAFDDSSKKEAKVKNGLSSYKSLIDIINSLQKNETFQGEIKKTNSETISSIKIEYLSQPIAENEPSPENNNWQTVIPDYKDRYAIWQKTTSYNHRGQILNTEIICLSNLNTAASYWIKCSARSHSGSQQNRTITITAMVKLGTNLETVDTNATIEYRWSDGSTKAPKETNSAEDYIAYPYELIFENTSVDPIPDADLYITAKRNGVIYEEETITFAPLNTPILILDNENDSITYDSYGKTKADIKAKVVSNAKVMLNNIEVENVTYNWELTNCSNLEEKPTVKDENGVEVENEDYYNGPIEVNNTPKIEIYHISNTTENATAKCIAIYKDNLNNDVSLTKQFSIKKNKLGTPGNSIKIHHAFCWTDDYLAKISAPNNTPDELGSSLSKSGNWAIPEEIPTKDDMNELNNNWKLVYLSTRTESISHETETPTTIELSAWTNPEVFLCANEDAYRILTTADGLFGYGQGVYYTPTETITLADGSTTKNAGEQLTQEQAAQFVALDPDRNKEKVELYINAEYIKTGAFTVGDESNPLFQAGLDTGVDKTPLVKIGGFSVSENTLSAEGKIKITNPETNNEEEVESKVSISTDAISVGPIDQTNNNVPLVISGTGEIIASKGSFSGQITASGAELKDTSYFSMASDGEAVFNALNATTIAVSDNISTKGRINSNNGYFFGPDATCGLSLEGTAVNIEQDCRISINASHMLIGGGTNDRYRITVSCSPAATKPITITFSEAQWGSGTNAISIARSSLTINAGSTSASTQRTVTNTSKYQLMYTMDGEIGGGIPTGGTNNPTSITTSPKITKIEVDGSTLYSSSSGTTSYTITQTTPSSSSNLKLDCSSFQMNGNIIIPNTATFTVKGTSNDNVVTLSKDGLTTDGKVQFKKNSTYYEPVISLNDTSSPNCFWSTTDEINSNKWKRISLPSDIRGKVIAAVVSSCATKPTGTADTSNEIEGNRPTYDFSSLKEKGVDKDVIPDLQTGIASGMIANCLYVDYTTSTYYVWVFNGQKEKATINLFVAAKI